MNEKLAMLIGLLLSDGSVYYDKSKKTYCIQFTNKSPDLRNLFRVLMEYCFGVKSFYMIPCRNAVSMRVFSKKIADSLFQYSPTFRTLPCKSFPCCNGFSCKICDILQKNGIDYPPSRIHSSIMQDSGLIKAFLYGFASGDGGIYINRENGIYTLEITCYHPFLKAQILDCLSSVGIKARVKPKAVLISGLKSFTKFMDEIGILK